MSTNSKEFSVCVRNFCIQFSVYLHNFVGDRFDGQYICELFVSPYNAWMLFYTSNLSLVPVSGRRYITHSKCMQPFMSAVIILVKE